MRSAAIFFCKLLLISATISHAQEVKNGGQDVKRIQLEYNFAGDDSSWFPRGTIVISNDKVTSLPSYTLTSEQYSQLKESVVKTNGLVKIRARFENEAVESSRYSFVKACSLYYSSLSDSISLYFDSTGSFMGLSVATHNPHCITSSDAPSVGSFNSTVEVFSATSGPLPDTQTYLLRLEQEKQEKLRGDKGDNRSFLAKYWIYIVPLVVFMLISGSSQPEGEAAS